MTEVTIKKWGNSLAIRLPKIALSKAGLTENDELNVSVDNDKIVLEAKPKVKSLEELFEGYDSSQPYPYEIVDKGGAVGHELY